MTIEDIDDELDGADAQDVTGLKRKVQRLLGHNRRLKDRVKELEAAKHSEPEPTPREKFLQEAARRLVGLEGDAKAAEIAKLEAEMAPLIDAEVAEHGRQLQEQIASQQQTIRRAMRERAATDLAMRIRRPGVALHVLTPLLLERFEVQETGEEFTVMVKGPDGQPITTEQLAEELRANPAFGPLVEGSTPQEKAAHAAKVAETLGQRPNGAAR